MSERLEDDRERAFGEVQGGQLVEGEPAGEGGVVGCGEGAAGDAAEVIDEDVVIFGAALRVAEDALEDLDYGERLDEQAGLFADFADDGVAEQFARFEDSAR